MNGESILKCKFWTTYWLMLTQETVHGAVSADGILVGEKGAQQCPVVGPLEMAVFGLGQPWPCIMKEPFSPLLITPGHLHVILRKL